METAFPYVQIPPQLRAIIGEPDEGTRIYRRDGSSEEAGAWFDVLDEVIGPAVSPGGVAMFCPVSRAAVHKRLKEGRLSAFLFHVTHHKTTLFGKTRVLRGTPLCYIPVSECKAWKVELEDEAVRRGYVTSEELRGAKPDWAGDFLEWKNKSERYRETLLADTEWMTIGQKLGLLKALLTGSDYEVVRKKDKKEEER